MTPEQGAESWGSDFAEPRRKSRVPVLAWVLGSGCLFLLLLVVVAVLAFGRIVSRAANPDVQWPLVAEVLPFDERPAGLQILGGKWGGTRTWLVFPKKDAEYQVLLLHVAGEGARKTRAKFFGGDAEVFTLDAQGRELQAVRGLPDELEEDAEWRDVMVNELASGPCLRLDLSPPGSADLLLLQWTEMHGEGPVDEERVLDFLDPFHLDRVR